MNKTELVDAIAAESGLSKTTARKVIEAYTKVVGIQLNKGEKIALVGFGTLVVTDKKARNGVNPATGKSITVAAKRVVKFKTGEALKKILN